MYKFNLGISLATGVITKIANRESFIDLRFQQGFTTIQNSWDLIKFHFLSLHQILYNLLISQDQKTI